MTRLRVGTWLALAIAAARMVAAQTPAPPAIDRANGLTIEDAVAEALRAEPLLGAARAEIAIAQGERRQAALRPNPDVMVEQREQARGSDRQTSLTLELPLDLFQRRARIQTADSAVTAAGASVRERERQVAIAVREQYGRVLEAARRVEIAEAVAAASARTHELLRVRVQEGAAPPLERDAALVELRRMEGARELAAGRLGVELSAMKRLLGRPSGAPLALRHTLDTAVELDASAAAGGAASERPDVQEATAAAAVAAAQSREARDSAKPSVSLFAGYMKMDQGFEQRGIDGAGALVPIQGTFHNLAAGVRVSLPLFDRAQGRIAAARSREAAALDIVRARRLQSDSEIAGATARLAAARRAAAVYSPDVRALAARNLDVTRETYTLGRATLFDVLNEQRRYLEFESAYADVLVEMFAAITALRSATGEMR